MDRKKIEQGTDLSTLADEWAAGRITEHHVADDGRTILIPELTLALRTGGLHRNFQGYSTRAECDLIGLGVSAIGSVGNVYSQNCKRLSDYYRALDGARLPVERGIVLSVDDQVRREVIQRIMCAGVVERHEIEGRYALDFASYFGAELETLRAMARDGLLSRLDERIVVSEKGRFLLRTIAMAFDAHLGPAAGEKYSKVI